VIHCEETNLGPGCSASCEHEIKKKKDEKTPTWSPDFDKCRVRQRKEKLGDGQWVIGMLIFHWNRSDQCCLYSAVQAKKKPSVQLSGAQLPRRDIFTLASWPFSLSSNH
jgi:hypothetical protein